MIWIQIASIHERFFKKKEKKTNFEKKNQHTATKDEKYPGMQN